MNLPTHDDVQAARTRLAGHIVRTPVLRHPLLDEMTGGTILLKPEPLQRTGSFKLRGATNAVMKLSPEARAAGVVTHSSGNHGQAMACAASAVGARATIFMPTDAPDIKVESTRRWGAEILRYDRHTDDREAIAHAHAARTGAVLVPPFDHADVIALFGHNVAETQTVLWMRMLDRLAGANPPALVCIDPRQTPVSRHAAVHLAPLPGTNVALMNALLHEVVRNDWVDHDYIAAHAVGFDELLGPAEPRGRARREHDRTVP